MTESDFIMKKLNNLVENIEELTDEEMRNAFKFVLITNKNHIDRLIESTKESINQNKELVDRVEYLTFKNEAFNDFLQDSGLLKEYEFYLRGFSPS